MRLLHVTHQYRPAIGGAEQYITQLSEELAQRGHHVDVLTSRSLDYRTWRTELPARESVNGVNIYRFRSLPRVGHTWRALRFGYERHFANRARRYEPFIWYGNGPVCPGMFAYIVLRGHQYDLIHINNLHYAHAALAATAARLRGLPILLTPHLHAEQPVTYDVGYMRGMLKHSDAIIADTEGEKEFVLAQDWCRDVTVAGVGLSLEEFPAVETTGARGHFGLPAGAFVILFLGRKTDYKGLDLCLEAFKTLRGQREEVYFLALGAETDESRRLWERYDELDGLIIRERVSDRERALALAACDVLALPSTGEAFGIVYLEAWAYRKPVIGARIASVSTLVSHGEDGFLIEPGDQEAMLCHLSALADDPSLGRRLGEQGWQKLNRRYTRARIGDIIEATTARVIRRHRTIHPRG